jgi:hypothetical protein
MLKRSFLLLLSYMLLFGIVQVAAPAPDSDIVKHSMIRNRYIIYLCLPRAHPSLFIVPPSSTSITQREKPPVKKMAMRSIFDV